MSLRDELDTARKVIKTDSYPISIRELSSLYKDKELDLHPEFQRFLRWSDDQKTKLIESILLGIPLPSVFLYQRDDGILDVVDGLQRLSTILQFMGELKNEDGGLVDPLILGEAQYIPSMKGRRWKSDSAELEIGDDIQKFFRQEKIDAKILLRDSDEHTKYELFQRINTGGTPLSDQEVRNCILILINRDAYFWLESLSKDSHFMSCCPIPDRLTLERYDLELVLRFAILYDMPVDGISRVADLGQFLTTEMRLKFAPNVSDLSKITDVFTRTFRALDAACSDNALRKYDESRQRFGGPFLISAFELVALGVAANLPFVESQGSTWLDAKIKAAWSDQRASGIYGQGVSTGRRLPKTLELGRAIFSEA
jgi:hypothetical protein